MDHLTDLAETRVAELTRLGATVERRDRDDDPGDPVYYVVHARPRRQRILRQLTVLQLRQIS